MKFSKTDFYYYKKSFTICTFKLILLHVKERGILIVADFDPKGYSVYPFMCAVLVFTLDYEFLFKSVLRRCVRPKTRHKRDLSKI